MQRKSKIVLVLIIVGVATIVFGYEQGLWGLSSLDYAPIAIVSALTTLSAWAWRDKIEKWVKASEPIEPAYPRRGYANQKTSKLRFGVASLIIPLLLLGNAGFYFWIVYSNLSKIFDPYALICYYGTGCSSQPVILLNLSTALDAIFGTVSIIAIRLAIQMLMSAYRQWKAH